MTKKSVADFLQCLFAFYLLPFIRRLQPELPLNGELGVLGFSIFGVEWVVFWCINVFLYSLLFGYIKHELKKYC